jgi:hypothetical protein
MLIAIGILLPMLNATEPDNYTSNMTICHKWMVVMTSCDV